MKKKKKGLGELGRGTWASRLRPRTPFLVRGLGQRSRSRHLPQTLYVTVNNNCLGFLHSYSSTSFIYLFFK